MTGLAGKLPTPTLLLLLAGVIMVITLWTSKKARSVVQTSLDLGRQHEGSERFNSYAVSRGIVRYFSRTAISVNNVLPSAMKNYVNKQFDERPFIAKQAHLGSEAPSFDLVRASVTLVVASILIALGTAMKLPLSTTYVTFMVFMGASLADGAWGRESAVYRVSGVISVVGGWFFTALSAFVVAFIVACLFYYGGPVAIVIVLALAAVIIYRTHKYHGKRTAEQQELAKAVEEGQLTKSKVVEMSIRHLTDILGAFIRTLDDTLDGLAREDLDKLSSTYKEFKKVEKTAWTLKARASTTLDRLEEDGIEAAHMYILVVDYLNEMAKHVTNIAKSSLSHVDNNHKPLLPEQIEELEVVFEDVKNQLISTIAAFKNLDEQSALELIEDVQSFVKVVRNVRKQQIKRIKEHKIGTRNSQLYLNHLSELRNLSLFSNRLVKVYLDLILNPEIPESLEEAAPVTEDDEDQETIG
jgi:Na+/phosphate symporter